VLSEQRTDKRPQMSAHGLGEMEESVTTHPCGPLSAAEVQALHRRVLAARDLDVDPDPTDLATAHQLNADDLARFDRTSSEEALKFH
jgi:hypothetical protein